ncbi:MFS transporter [Janibacter limosus]|uniref:MFS transporter n=1 Tax=Janibacter limosus TaxID=53458 RepID=A0AC61U808_9MICO|nr:MFS transporter [Janibacter limosus]UUZ46210.1 MFS transporter [Janibacter limosus]
MSTSATSGEPVAESGAGGTAFEDLPPRKTIRKAVAASAMGNATEWYDYGAYAVVATYIGHHFFPGEHETLLTTATLAVSFIARPFGGFFWGPLGDRLGRKGVPAMTIIMMSAATFSIGLLPTAETIGIGAPILLIILRLIRGFSTGGEYGGAATFMAEYAPDKRRGLYGSFLEFGTLGGFALGAGVVLVLQIVLGESAMNDWGWRLPFFIAGPLGGIGLYLRSKLDETPVYNDLEDAGESEESATHGLRDLMVEYWKPMLTMAGLVIPLNVVNYTLLTYMPTYLQTKIGIGENESLVVIIVGELIMMALLPFAGHYSDIIGRRPMWWFSLIGLFVFALPMYFLMGTGFVGAMVGFAVLGLLYIPQLSTISATFPAMFPAHVRFAGFAVTYNVFTAAFGGTAASVNEAAVEGTGFPEFPAAYMMGACVIGMIAMLFVKETAGASLHGKHIPESEPEDYGSEAIAEEAEAMEAAGR